MKKSILLLSLAALTIASCSHMDKETKYPKSKEDQELERMGKLTGDEGIVLFGGKKRGKSAADAINVNSYLWRAALDTVYFMPLLSADPFGGTILTDWYTSNTNTRERFKFNIIIVGAELRSDAIKVSSFKQIRESNGRWKEVKANPQLARDIEDKILIKARELKVNN